MNTTHFKYNYTFLYIFKNYTKKLQIFMLLVSAFQLSHHQACSLPTAVKILTACVVLRAHSRTIYVIKTYNVQFNPEQAMKAQSGSKDIVILFL